MKYRLDRLGIDEIVSGSSAALNFVNGAFLVSQALLMAGIHRVFDWIERHALHLLWFPCREPPVLAHMHGLPVEHWLRRDPILDLRVVSQQTGHKLTGVQNMIQEHAPASRTSQPMAWQAVGRVSGTWRAFSASATS